MDLVTALFGSLEAGLKLWGTKEARKYLDEWLWLKEAYYAEKRKPDPNMALLDDYERRLVLLSSAFTTAALGGQTTPVQPG